MIVRCDRCIHAFLQSAFCFCFVLFFTLIHIYITKHTTIWSVPEKKEIQRSSVVVGFGHIGLLLSWADWLLFWTLTPVFFDHVSTLLSYHYHLLN